MGNNKILLALAVVAFGFFEGFAVALSGVASPYFFRDQMTFTKYDKFAIMKYLLI